MVLLTWGCSGRFLTEDDVSVPRSLPTKPVSQVLSPSPSSVFSCTFPSSRPSFNPPYTANYNTERGRHVYITQVIATGDAIF